MTERRSDGARAVKAGDIWTENANTVHRFKNTTNTPCVFWTMSLLKKTGSLF